MSTSVTLATRNDVAIITFNNPKTLNAFTVPDWYTLIEHLQHVAKRDDITYTVLIGSGRFFSSGADVKAMTRPQIGPGESLRRIFFTRVASVNYELTRALFEHPKILVGILNGPAIGLAAAILGSCDFIYAIEGAYIATPFSSLGLVSEGGASYSFVQRMGIARANEALIHGKKFGANELQNIGFVNKVFPQMPAESLLDSVLGILGEKSVTLNKESMLKIKTLIQNRRRDDFYNANREECDEAVKVLMNGTPFEEFKKVAEGKKRHKL